MPPCRPSIRRCRQTASLVLVSGALAADSRPRLERRRPQSRRRDRLAATRRIHAAKIVDTLRRHPRFDEDFEKKMPEDVRPPTRRSRSLDFPAGGNLARHRSQDGLRSTDWHYIDVPLFLGASGR